MATSDEHTDPAAPRPEEKSENRGSGAGSFLIVALLGGLLAGGIGYLAAYYTEFGLFDTGQSELAQTVNQQTARLEELETQIAGSAQAQQEISGLQDNLSDVVARLDAIEAQAPAAADPESQSRLENLGQTVEDLQTQVSNLPSNAVAASRVNELNQSIEDLQAQVSESGQGAETQTTALQEQVAALDQRLTEQNEAIQAAAAEARQTGATAAIAEIRAAISNGNGYTQALETLRANIDGQLPEALTAPADQGVVTLPSLVERFPEASRQALPAAVSSNTEGPLDRTMAFLRSQTGARSLGEQEGTSPDAILSRAEARLTDGDLEAALSELDTLPQAGRDAMSDWLDEARTRLQANTALDDLSQTTTQN